MHDKLFSIPTLNSIPWQQQKPLLNFTLRLSILFIIWVLSEAKFYVSQNLRAFF